MNRWRRSAVAIASLATTASGAAALVRRRRRRRSDPRIFILEYHDLTDDGQEREGAISAARFHRHLRYLTRRYRLETVARAIELLREPGALREDRVVLTFDDGYAGNYRTAWPILRAEGAPATIFVTTGFLDGEELWFDFAARGLAAARRAGAALPADLGRALGRVYGRWPPRPGADRSVERLKYLPLEARTALLEGLRSADLPLPPPAEPLTWDQVREMRAGEIEIGCHTHTHPILALLSPAAQAEEIHRSTRRIAEEIGERPTTFAIPNGSARDFDADTLAILRATGYRAACLSVRGSNRPGCDPLALRRIGIGSDSTAVLAARLSGLFDEEVRRWVLDARAGRAP